MIHGSMEHYLSLGSVNRQKTKNAESSPAGISYSQNNVCRYYRVGNSLAWTLTAGSTLTACSLSQTELEANNYEGKFAIFNVHF